MKPRAFKLLVLFFSFKFKKSLTQDEPTWLDLRKQHAVFR